MSADDNLIPLLEWCMEAIDHLCCSAATEDLNEPCICGHCVRYLEAKQRIQAAKGDEYPKMLCRSCGTTLEFVVARGWVCLKCGVPGELPSEKELTDWWCMLGKGAEPNTNEDHIRNLVGECAEQWERAGIHSPGHGTDELRDALYAWSVEQTLKEAALRRIEELEQGPTEEEGPPGFHQVSIDALVDAVRSAGRGDFDPFDEDHARKVMEILANPEEFGEEEMTEEARKEIIERTRILWHRLPKPDPLTTGTLGAINEELERPDLGRCHARIRNDSGQYPAFHRRCDRSATTKLPTGPPVCERHERELAIFGEVLTLVRECVACGGNHDDGSSCPVENAERMEEEGQGLPAPDWVPESFYVIGVDPAKPGADKTVFPVQALKKAVEEFRKDQDVSDAGPVGEEPGGRAPEEVAEAQRDPGDRGPQGEAEDCGERNSLGDGRDNEGRRHDASVDDPGTQMPDPDNEASRLRAEGGEGALRIADVRAPRGECGNPDCRGGDIFPGELGISNYPCPICNKEMLEDARLRQLHLRFVKLPIEWKRGQCRWFRNDGLHLLGHIAFLWEANRDLNERAHQAETRLKHAGICWALRGGNPTLLDAGFDCKCCKEWFGEEG